MDTVDNSVSSGEIVEVESFDGARTDKWLKRGPSPVLCNATTGECTARPVFSDSDGMATYTNAAGTCTHPRVGLLLAVERFFQDSQLRKAIPAIRNGPSFIHVHSSLVHSSVPKTIGFISAGRSDRRGSRGGDCVSLFLSRFRNLRGGVDRA